MEGVELGGRYRLDGLLGRGAMGQIWSGMDLLLKRSVAVKLLLDGFHADSEQEQRFRQEAEVAAGLQHRHITVVHDAGTHDGRPFIVMELLDGEDLASILSRHGAGMPIGQILDLGVQLAKGLAAAHRFGVVHRDVKPGNIMVVDGQAKICDFGIARIIQEGVYTVTAGIGTHVYMAPEQFQGRVDERADLYSLGCVLYEMSTGIRPLEGTAFELLDKHYRRELPEDPCALREELPGEFGQYVMHLLAKDAGNRPQRSADVAVRLGEIRRGIQQAKIEVIASNVQSLREHREIPRTNRIFKAVPLRLLNAGSPARSRTGANDAVAEAVREVLRASNLDVTLGSVSRGPTVSQYEVRLGPAVPSSVIEDLAGPLRAALGDFVVVPSIPSGAALPDGRSVGLDVPNADRDYVSLGDVLRAGPDETGTLTVGLGRGTDGPVFADLSDMPHLLIAGGPCSGKATVLKTIIASLLIETVPDDLCLMIADPTGVGLARFEGVPHLFMPVSTDARRAIAMLKAIEKEISQRYDDLAAAGCRQLDDFNHLVSTGDIPIPFPRFGREGGHPRIVALVAELAELMALSPMATASHINEITRLGRAVGVHLVLTTGRTTSRVLPMQVRAFIPARFALTMSSEDESDLVLERLGAERLLGEGDALWVNTLGAEPVRIQSASISDSEVDSIVAYWRNQV